MYSKYMYLVPKEWDTIKVILDVFITIKKHCKNFKQLWWEQLSQITSLMELIQLGGNIWYYECNIFGYISACSVLFHYTVLCMVTFVKILVPCLQVSNYNLRYTFHIQGRKKEEVVVFKHLFFFLLENEMSPYSLQKKYPFTFHFPELYHVAFLLVSRLIESIGIYSLYSRGREGGKGDQERVMMMNHPEASTRKQIYKRIILNENIQI